MRIDSQTEIYDFTGSEADGAIPEATDTKLTDGAETGNNRPPTRFRKGASGNPNGRPPGRRSRASLLREARLAERIDRELDGLVDALLGKALSGHVGAIRTVLALSLSHRRLDLPDLAGEAATRRTGQRCRTLYYQQRTAVGRRPRRHPGPRPRTSHSLY